LPTQFRECMAVPRRTWDATHRSPHARSKWLSDALPSRLLRPARSRFARSSAWVGASRVQRGSHVCAYEGGRARYAFRFPIIPRFARGTLRSLVRRGGREQSKQFPRRAGVLTQEINFDVGASLQPTVNEFPKHTQQNPDRSAGVDTLVDVRDQNPIAPPSTPPAKPSGSPPASPSLDFKGSSSNPSSSVIHLWRSGKPDVRGDRSPGKSHTARRRYRPRLFQVSLSH